MTNSSQLIFLKGKEQALKTLFNSDNFGYLAIGFDAEDKGFTDEANKTIAELGFKEIDGNTESTYQEKGRLKLVYKDTQWDWDNSQVLVRFTATLPADEITSGQNINQMAVVNNATANAADTVFYSATSFPVFSKTASSSITFIIGFKM